MTGVLVQIQFIASIAAITADPAASRRLYVDALGLPLHGEDDGYYHSEQIAGSKSFGVWPLTQAAQACFGIPDWPAEHPIPQASIEFEVPDAEAVGPAAAELVDRGIALLHEARLEPWGQTVARLLSPEGLIVGISYAPSLH
jgi:catechol 2,3-dioxygenase-like lactoylglutathione lyase family enzyme